MTNEQSYSVELIWVIADYLAVFAYWITPILILVISLLAWRGSGSHRFIIWSGALIYCGSWLVRMLLGEVYSVTLTSLHPAHDQGALHFFSFHYGQKIGLAIFLAGILFHLQKLSVRR